MSAFSALDMINPKARQQAAAVREYKEIYLNPKEVKEAPENTRKTYEGIEALADSFLLVGQEQPTVLARVNGEFLIVDGHRRNRANLLNLERGYTKFEKVRYFFRDMSETMYELALLSGNGYTQGLTDYEKTELAARLKRVLEKMRENGEISKEGRIRDIVGGILGEKPTNMARIEKINNSATPEIKEEFKKGNIGISKAYEAARLPEEEQKAIAARAAAGEDLKTKEIAQKVAEKVAAKAQEKAEKAAEDAEKANIEAEQAIADAAEKQEKAEEEAQNAKELKRYVDASTALAEMSETDTEALINTGQEKAEEEAQNAKELKRYVDASTALAEMSETDTEALINTGLPGDRSTWNTRQWAIYTLRRMMYVVDALSYDDVQAMQEILIRAENPEKSQGEGQDTAAGQEGGEHEDKRS